MPAAKESRRNKRRRARDANSGNGGAGNSGAPSATEPETATDGRGTGQTTALPAQGSPEQPHSPATAPAAQQAGVSIHSASADRGGRAGRSNDAAGARPGAGPGTPPGSAGRRPDPRTAARSSRRHNPSSQTRQRYAPPPQPRQAEQQQQPPSLATLLNHFAVHLWGPGEADPLPQPIGEWIESLRAQTLLHHSDLVNDVTAGVARMMRAQAIAVQRELAQSNLAHNRRFTSALDYIDQLERVIDAAAHEAQEQGRPPIAKPTRPPHLQRPTPPTQDFDTPPNQQ